MRFGILGPLRVEGPAGPVVLNAPRQRSLLAALLLAHRQDTVAIDRLIDALWGEHPPATAVKSVQVHISQLRRALGPDVIRTRPTGYAIALEPEAFDLARFETLVARARGEAPEQAADTLREALALFRGPPLADAMLLGPAAVEADRIENARLDALEQRIGHDLALGRHAELVPELEGADRRSPLPRAPARAAACSPSTAPAARPKRWTPTSAPATPWSRTWAWTPPPPSSAWRPRSSPTTRRSNLKGQAPLGSPQGRPRCRIRRRRCSGARRIWRPQRSCWPSRGCGW